MNHDNMRTIKLRGNLYNLDLKSRLVSKFTDEYTLMTKDDCTKFAKQGDFMHVNLNVSCNPVQFTKERILRENCENENKHYGKVSINGKYYTTDIGRENVYLDVREGLEPLPADTILALANEPNLSFMCGTTKISVNSIVQYLLDNGIPKDHLKHIVIGSKSYLVNTSSDRGTLFKFEEGFKKISREELRFVYDQGGFWWDNKHLCVRFSDLEKSNFPASVKSVKFFGRLRAIDLKTNTLYEHFEGLEPVVLEDIKFLDKDLRLVEFFDDHLQKMVVTTYGAFINANFPGKLVCVDSVGNATEIPTDKLGGLVCNKVLVDGKPMDTVSPGGGYRVETGMPRYDLIPPTPLRMLAETFAEGVVKYGEGNCFKGLPMSNLYNHCVNHLELFRLGDTSEPHLAHALWNLAMMAEFSVNFPEMNDLRKYFDVYPKSASKVCKDATPTSVPVSKGNCGGVCNKSNENLQTPPKSS